MKPSINLATKRIIQKKTLRKFFLSSVIFFGAGVSTTILLLLINFFVNLQISNLTEDKADLQAQIVRQRVTKDKLLMIQERLGQIRSLLTARNAAGENINLIVSSIPQSIRIVSINYDEEEISFSLSSDSLSALQTLIEDELPALGSGANKNFGEITLGNFKLDSENTQYITSFSIKRESTDKKAPARR